MAEHDPPVVVIPSEGKARPVRPSPAANNEGRDDEEDSATVTDTPQQQRMSSDSLNNKRGEYNPIITILKAIWTNHDLSLDNVGSVARDHLANERTFLAWMRTSLALSSIGVAITQLFRLTSSSYTLPSETTQDPGAIGPDFPPNAGISTISSDEISAAVASLISTVQQQQQAILALGLSTDSEKKRYQKLGKPIGGTFLVLGLIFMALGGHRYISIQRNLTTKNQFPPARRSVLISSFLVMALLVATFASILSI